METSAWDGVRGQFSLSRPICQPLTLGEVQTEHLVRSALAEIVHDLGGCRVEVDVKPLPG